MKKPLEDYIDNIKNFLRNGDFSNALNIINDALTDYPSNPKLYINGGNIYKINGDLENAEIYFKKALMLNKSKEVLNNLSVIELEKYNYQQSIDYAMDAIKLDPSYSDAYYNLALSLERIGDYRQAINYADKSYKLSKNIKYLILLYRVLQNTCDWEGMNSILSDLDANIGSGIEHPFLNISRTDDEAINFIVAKSWAENNILKTPMKVDINNNEKNNKIRLGYICGELRNHPTYHLIKNLFKNHNKEDFEIYIFSYNHENDIKNEIQKDVDQFISIDGTSDKDAIELISKLNIDILIDLSIIITNNRQKIMSSRPAKKVISYLGYPGTSGYDFYDYIITDKIVTPENIQPYYLEKFLYLPNTYQVSNGIKNIPMKGNLKSDYGLPNESIVLSCFNQSFKIDKIIFESWMNILKNLSSAYLWILEDNEVAKENLTECAKLHGISSDRLIFAPRIDRDRHLERLTLVDVALDTRIYNGHTTTTDALQSSVPVVTIMGKHFASRVSSSLLSLIGLDELIAHNTQEYEEKIIKLCSEKTYLKKIKEKLSNDVCMKKFYDIKEFTYEFELCLKGILKN
ncbi:tetratricopeptide repeat protein [Gammaproteobacteria bacterium]|nr:tetratricopeptide repeat protein [Gammaproteobacteria bacterium]